MWLHRLCASEAENAESLWTCKPTQYKAAPINNNVSLIGACGSLGYHQASSRLTVAMRRMMDIQRCVPVCASHEFDRTFSGLPSGAIPGNSWGCARRCSAGSSRHEPALILVTACVSVCLYVAMPSVGIANGQNRLSSTSCSHQEDLEPCLCNIEVCELSIGQRDQTTISDRL